MSSVSGQIYGGQPTIYGASYLPVEMPRYQRYIPAPRQTYQPIIRPIGTDMTTGQRNIDLTKGTEYDLNPGEVIMNKGTKDAIVVGEGAPRGWLGIPRAFTGAVDFLTKHTPLPDTDWDKRGGGKDYGNLPTEGLGRKPTLKQPEISQTDINTPDPGSMPGYDPRTGLPDYDTQQDISAWRSRDAADLYRDRTRQRIGDINRTANEIQRITPLIRDQLLTSRLMTENLSPAEKMKRLRIMTDNALNEANAMNQYQTAANDWVRATNTMPSRSFGQAVVANVPNISGRA